jgi:SulP family sulfate permease
MKTMNIAYVLRTPRVLVRECLAGVVTALVLMPELISFSVIGGVDPKVTLFASVVLCLMMSFLGGRPAMVTAAAGAVALVIGPLVAAHGAQYILPTVLLAGVIQIMFGVTGLSGMIRYVPRAVMIGFMNALAIMIFVAQIPHVWGESPLVLVLFAATICVIVLFPYINKTIPSPLVAIAGLTAVASLASLDVPTVGSGGMMASGLPSLNRWVVPFDLTTLQIIWPTAVSVALVGLLESLLTAKLVDELTDTTSSKRRESWALGVSNICAGFYGGIAGCAMIGQTVVNVKMGEARSRVSTVVAALVLFLLATSFSAVMAEIPMVVLAGMMVIVSLKIVDWHSLQLATLKRMTWGSTLVMVSTVVATVFTKNLAIGVGVGTLWAIVLLTRRGAHALRVERQVSDDQQSVRYTVLGPLFFPSSNDLVAHFQYADDPPNVTIDLDHAQIWDSSSVAELDAIERKYSRYGTTVTFVEMDQRSTDIHERLHGQL